MNTNKLVRSPDQRPAMVSGTKRQSLTAADGTVLERQYIYLAPAVWEALQAKARTTGTSVSQVIAAHAVSGTVNSKDQYVSTRN